MVRQVPLFLLAAVLASPVSNGALAQDTSAESAVEPTPPAPLFVRTVVLDDPGAALERQFFGRIAARDTAALSFEVPGALEVLNAAEGTRVAKGDLIAALDLAPFERSVRRAELSLAQAERDLERAKTLASRNVSSEVRAQDAETARDLAIVALADARAALEDAQIIAPFDGLIADRLVANFTNISAGLPIVRVHDLSEIRVEFDLPERILSAIGDPTAAQFSARMPGAADPTALEFREIQAETGAVGQSYTISLAATDTGAMNVLPGQTVTITAALPSTAKGVPVPATAVVSRPEGGMAVVALSSEDGTLTPEFLPVDVLSQTGADISVRGVAPGTEIVELGAHLVRPGQPLARYEGLIVEGN
ncbi:MAG: efflux RND transporter periplasmic adaptor subunit [Pseudomonadota bacterium]